jgi:biopolymer transport protein TolR
MSFHLDGRHDMDENHRSRPSLLAEINMTPFVDVCLVLLIIFMVTAPFAISGVNVKLPESRAKSLSMASDSVILSVTKKGEYYLGKTQVQEGSLTAQIKEIFVDTPSPILFIRADKDVPYSRVMTAMAAAQRAGVEKIGMIGENKRDGK